jgi:hypothetical protein
LTKEIGLKVRRLVEKWTADNTEVTSDDLCGACAIASFALWRVLRSLGIKAKIVCVIVAAFGESHCWVEVGGLAYDLTATQFDSNAAKVEVRSVAYMARKFRGKRYEGKEAEEYISSWGSQSPVRYRSKISSMVYRIRRNVLDSNNNGALRRT